MSTIDNIHQKLADAFAPVHLDVRDDSEQHRGHGGFREGVTTHVHVSIRAAAFDGMSRVARQRAVMSALRDELEGPVHALALDVQGAAG